MSNKLREFHRPADETAAIELLRRADVVSAALIFGPRVPEDRLAGVEAAVDLARLGLAYIDEDGDGTLRLGALTTLRGLSESALLNSLAGGIVAEAAHVSAASGMRQAATLGGTLLAQPELVVGELRSGPPELLLALLVLDAELRFRDAAGTTRAVLFDQYLATPLVDGELLIEARVRRPNGRTGAALAGVARTPRDQSIVAAAALVTHVAGQPPRVRLAIGGASPFPLRITAAEALLAGGSVGEQLIQSIAPIVEAAVSPVDDFRASAEYRRAMAGVLAVRAIRQAWQAAERA